MCRAPAPPTVQPEKPARFRHLFGPKSLRTEALLVPPQPGPLQVTHWTQNVSFSEDSKLIRSFQEGHCVRQHLLPALAAFWEGSPFRSLPLSLAPQSINFKNQLGSDTTPRVLIPSLHSRPTL